MAIRRAWWTSGIRRCAWWTTWRASRNWWRAWWTTCSFGTARCHAWLIAWGSTRVGMPAVQGQGTRPIDASLLRLLRLFDEAPGLGAGAGAGHEAAQGQRCLGRMPHSRSATMVAHSVSTGARFTRMGGGGRSIAGEPYPDALPPVTRPLRRHPPCRRGRDCPGRREATGQRANMDGMQAGCEGRPFRLHVTRGTCQRLEAGSSQQRVALPSVNSASLPSWQWHG